MNKTLLMAKFTFIEVYRSKIVIALLVLAIITFVISFLASSFAYGAPERVALDIGLGLMSLSNVVISIFLGSALIYKEIESRTLYMVLSKPIGRKSFLIGKILGLSTMLILNTIIQTLCAVVISYYFHGNISHLVFWTAYFSLMESLIVMLFAVFFSLVTNLTMAVFYTILVFVAGHGLNEATKDFVNKSFNQLNPVIEVISFIIPNLSKFNLKDFILYKQTLEIKYLLGVNAYGIVFSLALMIIVCTIFERKNLD
jgi:ABC-type transport system involved in multi-copper enzyme maturation permease subunit